MKIRVFSKWMCSGSLIAASLLSLGGTTPSFAQGKPNEKFIQKLIAQEVKQLAKEGCELQNEPKTFFADLNADGKQELLISINFEACGGGNNWGQVHIAYDGQKEDEKKLGELTTLGVMKIYTRGQSLRMEGLDYGPDDPRCCPSVKFNKQLTLANGKLMLK